MGEVKDHGCCFCSFFRLSVVRIVTRRSFDRNISKILEKIIIRIFTKVRIFATNFN